MHHPRNSIIIISFALLALQCKRNPSLAPISNQDQIGSIQPGSLLPPTYNPNTNDPAQGYVVEHKRYKISVRGPLNIRVCQGELSIGIKSNFQIDLPSPSVSCMGAKIDLGGMLGGVAGNTGSTSGGLANIGQQIFAYNNILHLKSIGGFTYSPGLPIILSPLAMLPEQLATFDFTQAVNVQGNGVQAYGYVRTKVISVNSSYRSPHSSQSFDNVLVWERTTAGYPENIKAKALLFDKLAMSWDLPTSESSNVGTESKQLALPKILIEGSLSAFLGKDINTPSAMINLLAQIVASKIKVEIEIMD